MVGVGNKTNNFTHTSTCKDSELGINEYKVLPGCTTTAMSVFASSTIGMRRAATLNKSHKIRFKHIMP